MSSRSESDSESNHSASPLHQGPAPTPGHGLDRSASNSPQYARSQASQGASPGRAESRTSRSRSGSPASSARSRSRSGSAESNKSAASRRSDASRKSRSRSVASNRSRGSQSAGSNRSGSQKSGGGSQRSGSNRSAGSQRSRSRSRSSSAGSRKSRSSSAGSKKSRSRSGSPASNKSRSRSRSGGSNKSGSRSPSRSRSASVASNRSKSAASNRSKSAESNRSKSAESNRSRGSRSRSRSPSQAKAAGSQANSRSGSPHLQIDEPGSPESGKGDKRKRDSSEEPVTKKKNRIIDTDSEEEVEVPRKEEDKEVSAAAIFGDADDISSEEEKDKAESDRDGRRSDDDEREERRQRSDEENEPRQAEYEEDKENEPEPIPETRIDVEIPKISCDLGRDIHFVKLPNFLSVETRPFDPETYEDEIDEEETLDEEGRARLKLKVENTIRWKEVMDKEGNTSKESNARLVRWSDGSYSLHLGSEIFDVYKQPLQGDHNHLFIRQGTGLQGQAVFRTKLSFRPHSTESFTHRKMTLSLADRSQKTSGIKILSQVGADPDHDRKNLLKKEEEKLRQTVRQSKPRTRKGEGGSRTHNSSSVYREEEGSDEEGAISLNAIKNKYKTGAAGTAKGGAIYSSDEEGSDIEARRARKLDKAKVLKDSESSEDSE